MTKLRLFPVVLALSLGCGGGSTPVDASRPVDAALSLDAPAADAPPVDAPRPDTGTSDWIDTPYLSTTPVRSFGAAGVGTTPGVDYGARIVTDVGTIVLDLAEDEAPITVNSFAFLARNHFFDGIAFHRVIEGFMAQGGDPNTIAGPRSSWGTGGPGYQFANEIDPSLSFDGPGVIGMANAGPNTNGSQFFITFAPATHLDGAYNIFGHVIEGQSVLGSIARGEPPATPTLITTIQIIER
jgi:cyclophilin family peptidyl-prolyl cis-trans isomerase